jgi:hypothetical protein
MTPGADARQDGADLGQRGAAGGGVRGAGRGGHVRGLRTGRCAPPPDLPWAASPAPPLPAPTGGSFFVRRAHGGVWPRARGVRAALGGGPSASARSGGGVRRDLHPVPPATRPPPPVLRGAGTALRAGGVAGTRHRWRTRCCLGAWSDRRTVLVRAPVPRRPPLPHRRVRAPAGVAALPDEVDFPPVGLSLGPQSAADRQAARERDALAGRVEALAKRVAGGAAADKETQQLAQGRRAPSCPAARGAWRGARWVKRGEGEK